MMVLGFHSEIHFEYLKAGSQRVFERPGEKCEALDRFTKSLVTHRHTKIHFRTMNLVKRGNSRSKKQKEIAFFS